MKLLEEKEKEVEILKKKVGGDSKTIYEQLGGKAAMVIYNLYFFILVIKIHILLFLLT